MTQPDVVFQVTVTAAGTAVICRECGKTLSRMILPQSVGAVIARHSKEHGIE